MRSSLPAALFSLFDILSLEGKVEIKVLQEFKAKVKVYLPNNDSEIFKGTIQKVVCIYNDKKYEGIRVIPDEEEWTLSNAGIEPPPYLLMLKDIPDSFFELEIIERY